MDNFVYHHPVKIIFGKNSLDSLASEVSALGNRVLLVSGQSSLKQNGIHHRIVEALQDQHVEIIEFPGARPHPLLSHVHDGIEKVRKSSCNTVIAAGGGSVIDTAKSIAAGVRVNHDVWKFFTGKKSVHSRLPLITIPTVAGSGSEINHGMVLTNDKLQHKFGFGHRFLIPDVCLADPLLTCSVPAAQTAAGAVDTLCHCLEPYLSTSADSIALQKGFLETVSRTVVETVPSCIEHPQSYKDRSSLLWCSMAAMSGFGTAGLGKVYFSLHGLEHGISVLTGAPHGHGLAALLPGWFECHKTRVAGRLAEWGEKVFGLNQGGIDAKADATIDAFRSFLQFIGCPVCLDELGISRKDCDIIVDHALAQARIWRLHEFTDDSIRATLDHCFRS